MELVELYSYRTAAIGGEYFKLPLSHVRWAMTALIEKTFGRNLWDNHFVLGFKCDPWDVEDTPAKGCEKVYLYISDSKATWGTELHVQKKLNWQYAWEPKNDWANAYSSKCRAVAPIVEVR